MVRQRPRCSWSCNDSADHPHVGGEGRAKGGRPSASPWWKPPKQDLGNFWGLGNSEFSSCHDDLYGRGLFLMLSC